MSDSGNYVRTLAEASHALPQGLRRDAGFLPAVVSVQGRRVTLRFGEEVRTVEIVRINGKESCALDVRQYDPATGARPRKPLRPRPLCHPRR